MDTGTSLTSSSLDDDDESDDDSDPLEESSESDESSEEPLSYCESKDNELLVAEFASELTISWI